MCIIIYQPKGKNIPKKHLKESWISNSDGAGMMWAHDGKLHIHKELNNFRKFYKVYRNVVTKLECSIVVHFRIGTSGKLDEVNCHPFYVNEDLAFCHNGIMPYSVPKDSVISDTVIFNRKILQNLKPSFLDDEAIVELISGYIDGSKLAFMNKHGEVKLINEDEGNWNNGIWYSNHSYEKSKVSKYDGDMWYNNSSNYCKNCGTYMYYGVNDYCVNCQEKLKGGETYQEKLKGDKAGLWKNTWDDVCDICGKASEHLITTDAGQLCVSCYTNIEEGVI